MKIALISDTHGAIHPIVRYLKDSPIDMIFHLGDHADDGRALGAELNMGVELVSGNNDYGDTAPSERVVRLENHVIFLTHGHRYGVYHGLDRLYGQAVEEGADLVFFGHTHCFTDEQYRGVRLINPGSPTYPRDGKPGFLIWDTEIQVFNRIRIQPERGRFFR